MKRYLFLFVSLVLFSACQSSTTSTWSCSENKKVLFEAPSGTYHLSLSLLKSCQSGLIHLYAGESMMNVEYELKSISNQTVIYEGDWYENLTVEYLNPEDTEGEKVEVRVVFYYN